MIDTILSRIKNRPDNLPLLTHHNTVIEILQWASLALEKSFRVTYSYTHLNSRQTVPLTHPYNCVTW